MNLKAKNKLLHNRAGFGKLVKQPVPISELVDSLFPQGQALPLSVVTPEQWAENSPKALKMITNEEERKQKQNTFKKRTLELNLLWIKEMVATEYPLREKMSLFWHGHFASHIAQPYYDQELLQIVRENALGNFRDLLFGVSKSSSMLQFLNNQQNKKEHPNENFAREVMELFTLGRGHYTETDIKEAARAFTGWGFNNEGQFLFRKRAHDDGVKHVLGETGNFDGEAVLDILLKKKETAYFITRKICAYFVSDEGLPEKHVQQLASAFYDSGYDITVLLKVVFTSSWFYEYGAAGSKIKSPVELLVGSMRLLPLHFENDKMLIRIQRSLGQLLFYPPNVAGWAGGKSWIDSSSLMLRMRLPEAFYASKELDLTDKTDDQLSDEVSFRLGKVSADWSSYLQHWSDTPDNEIVDTLADALLAVPVSKSKLSLIKKHVDKDTREELVKSATLLLMEIPEYQLT